MVPLFFNSNTKWLFTLHRQRKKSVKRTTFDTFLRRVNFILMFIQEELASFLSAGKLVNLCPVKKFSLILTLVAPCSRWNYVAVWPGLFAAF